MLSKKGGIVWKPICCFVSAMNLIEIYGTQKLTLFSIKIWQLCLLAQNLTTTLKLLDYEQPHWIQSSPSKKLRLNRLCFFKGTFFSCFHLKEMKRSSTHQLCLIKQIYNLLLKFICVPVGHGVHERTVERKML